MNKNSHKKIFLTCRLHQPDEFVLQKGIKMGN